MGKKLSDKDKQMLINLKPEDITFDLLNELFSDKGKVVNGKMQTIPSRLQTSDEFDLNANEYFNKTKVTTNCGLFIYNKLIIERELSGVLGYINIPLDGNVVSDIEGKLSEALLDDVITVEEFHKYLNRTQWLSMQYHAPIAPSFSLNMLRPNKTAIKERDRLLKENKDLIAAGDVFTAVKIENEVLKIAEKSLENDYAMDLYKSKARGSFGNNYKNISIMKGPIVNPTTGKYEIVTSSLMEGIKKEDIHNYGNAVVSSSYPKAVGTAESGYFSKQIIAALQAVVIDESSMDCGTKGHLKVTVTKDNTSDFVNRYIMEGNKPLLITKDNITKYIGKEVKLRSPMFCIGDKLCKACIGELYTKTGITNIGLTASRVSSTLLNLSMKKFHDTTVKLYKIDINDMVI